MSDVHITTKTSVTLQHGLSVTLQLSLSSGFFSERRVPFQLSGQRRVLSFTDRGSGWARFKYRTRVDAHHELVSNWISRGPRCALTIQSRKYSVLVFNQSILLYPHRAIATTLPASDVNWMCDASRGRHLNMHFRCNRN